MPTPEHSPRQKDITASTTGRSGYEKPPRYIIVRPAQVPGQPSTELPQQHLQPILENQYQQPKPEQQYQQPKQPTQPQQPKRTNRRIN